MGWIRSKMYEIACRKDFNLTSQRTVSERFNAPHIQWCHACRHCRHHAGSYSDGFVLHTFDMEVLRAETCVGRTAETGPVFTQFVARHRLPGTPARRIGSAKPGAREPTGLFPPLGASRSSCWSRRG